MKAVWRWTEKRFEDASAGFFVLFMIGVSFLPGALITLFLFEAPRSLIPVDDRYKSWAHLCMLLLWPFFVGYMIRTGGLESILDAASGRPEG